MLEETGRETKYLMNKTPGRSWFEGFLRRHPSIKQKHAESVSKARAAVTKDRIHGWYDEINTFLKEGSLEDILADPSRIFNGDEAGFCLCPKSGKVLGPAKNNEDFYVRVSSEKEQITVMATFSADGTYVPPMIIFPYKRVPQLIAESVPENWVLGRSDSGWMTLVVFYEYISNHFLPFLKTNNIQKPIILFVDGHQSHMTKEVSLLCDENGIILISLFPNTTHIMQPADVAVFKPLKSGWASEVRKWKFENFPKDVTRFTFGNILKSVFDKYAVEKTIKNGFRKSGIYPFEKDNVDYSKCIPNRNVSVEKKEENLQLECNDKKLSCQLLEILERKIEKKDLDDFLKAYSSNEIWTGDASSLKLYNVWASFKNETGTLIDKGIPESLVEIQDNPKLLEPNQSVTKKNSSPKAGPSKCTQWNTPPERTVCYYEEKEHQGFKIPTPFKKCLVFPESTDATNMKTPKQKRKIFPAVVSSEKYREYYKREVNKKIVKQKTKKPSIRKLADEESSSDSNMDVTLEDEDLDISEPENLVLSVGKYVIVKYDNSYYPGMVIKYDLDGDTAEIRTMVSAGMNSWKWPSKEDILCYFKEDIICCIQEPHVKNNRGHFSVPEIEKYI